MQKSFAMAAIVAALADQALAGDKCYALALSSGDQNSMYQAGVLKGFAATLPAGELSYSAVSGVSGGAVNTAILANYPEGQEDAAADRMKTFWDNSANTKLYKDWLGGLAEGLLLKGGLWNDAGVLDFLESELADISATNRWIDIGLTDVLKGTYVDFKEENLTGDDLNQVLYAQFASAGVFPPVEYNNTDYFDGSTIWDLDIFSVVNQCQALGFADEDIVVDVVMTSEKTLKTVDASNYKSIQMLWRYLEVSRYYSNMDGLLRAQFAYPNVCFRNIMAPSAEMPSSFYPLNLDQSEVDQIWDLGVTDGSTATTACNSNGDLSQYYSLKKKNDSRVRGGVSFESFQQMKSAGAFEDFNMLEDKQMKALFLQ